VSTIAQQKLIARRGEARVRRWSLDLEAMASCSEWSQENPALLEQELTELIAAFPTAIACAGVPLGSARCWVEAAEPLLDEGELVIFDRGPRNVTSEQRVSLPEDTVNGVIVRIPSPISGRPFAGALDRRLLALERSDPARAARWRECLIEVKGARYLAPRFGMWFAQSWPHADPPVMVWSEYFEMLDIPADHVYYADQYYRLCLYAQWREQPAAQVLQNRVVPRLLIDLMIADLHALGRLDEALERLEMSLYEMYNVVGRPALVEPLRQVYRDLVGRSAEDAPII
jgi:hypothetical protein